jgi:two-component system sensor histidine kinase UhpB
MRSLVGERDVRSARAAASALEQQLNHQSAAVLGLSLRLGMNTKPEVLTDILQESEFLLDDFDKGLAFYRQGTGIVAQFGDESFWNDLDIDILANQPGITGFAGKTHFITLSDSEDESQVIIVYATPNSHGLIGAAAFTPEHLIQSTIGDVLQLSGNGNAYIIDQQGRMLYQVGTMLNANQKIQNHPGVKEALRGLSGSTFMDAEEGEHVVAYSPVSQMGWALIMEEPWGDVTSPLLRATEYAPLVLIPIAVLFIITLWFGTRRIVQPLRSLEAKASELGWGHFEAIEEPVGGVAEIRHLQTELINLAQKVKAAQQGLRGYIGVMTQGLEEERLRLARELHDETLQSLIALNQRIQLTLLSMQNDRGMEKLEEIQAITESTIQDLRRVTRALRPIYLEDLGLVAALEMLARETQQLLESEIHFQCKGAEQRLPSDVELALYRMVQEALSNVARHAEAEQTWVEISFTNLEVNIEVRDDGRGFNVPESPSAFAPGGHYGLLGLYERAALVGARLDILSEPGNGTRVSINLPIDHPPG